MEEIETKKAIKTDNSNRKPEKSDESWLNVTDISSLLKSNPSPLKFDNSLFQSFDLLVNKETPTKAEANRPPSRMSLPVLPNKEVEKYRKNPSEINRSNFKNQQEKDSPLKDRLFKMKIFETIKCKKA